jgi:predicted DNA-binding antitoxin AbrB/MazE fold protein
MEIQTLWQDGVFKPMQPLRLKRTLVTIKVPDEEIADIDPPKGKEYTSEPYKTAPVVQTRADALLIRLEQIHNEILALPEDQLPIVTDKQLERMHAMEMREDR